MIKIALFLAFIMLHVVAQNEEYDPNWCKLEAEFGPENCPIQRGDYDRCVTCTSTYFYSCGKYFLYINKKNPLKLTFSKIFTLRYMQYAYLFCSSYECFEFSIQWFQCVLHLF